MKNNERTLGLYLHIPFCLKKCAYCDFYSQSDYTLTDSYLDALLKEVAMAAVYYPDRVVDTVYIGGGTPSSLTAEQLNRLLSTLFSLFRMEKDAEVTLEANPATLDYEKLTVLKNAGVNRLSIGLQSAQNRELKTLSRLHSYEDFCQTFRLAKRFFDNLSLDLMFGLPDQTTETFFQTLAEAVALSPAHISMYALKIEEETPFAKRLDSLALPDEDAVADMYLSACSFLEKNGYYQYEISNFARQGCRSRHNLRYWKREEYLGFGPAAHSFIQNRRYANARDIHAYIQALSQGLLPPRSEDVFLSNEDATEEEILLSLRLSDGLNLSHLYEKTGYAMEKAAKEKLRLFEANGYLKQQGDTIALTPKGFLVSNTIIASLLP